jgi:hypothetical protein
VSRYNEAAERLWEKLLYYRPKLDFSVVDLAKPFPLDQMTKRNPLVKSLVAEVNRELSYELSEAQCSWAIVQVIRGESLDKYNNLNGTSLEVRP